MGAPTPAVIPHDSPLVATVKYLYFMRFSIILWLFFPMLAVFDGTKVSAMTRGIVALESGWHVFFASFFVVIAGWVALLSARITSEYGEERFGSAPPTFFQLGPMSPWTFWGAQLPGFSLLAYVWYRTATEQGEKGNLHQWTIAISLLLGLVAALLCWILLAAIYYWLYWIPGAKVKEDFPSKPFLIPYAEYFKPLEGWQPSAPLLALLQLFERAARGGPGYARADRGTFTLHSGHVLAWLTLGFLATVYLAFWDFTAPIELVQVRLIERIIFVAAALIWAVLSWRAKSRFNKPFKWRDAIWMVLLFSPMFLTVSLPFFWDNDSSAMPVLGFVTVLLMFILWGLAALAFFLDRFRVPVLTSLGVFFLALNSVTGDHYLKRLPVPDSLGQKDGPGKLPTPKTVLDRFQERATSVNGPSATNVDSRKPKAARPVIVVTATGGGIHAAAWTSSVLAKVEEEFRAKGASFHESILLMSTVSGGSVGTVPWLVNYTPGEGFGRMVQKTAAQAGKAPDKETPIPRERAIAECSDLQAAAWGLTYADFLRILLPFRWSNLGRTLDTYDRGWALEQAFWRNRKTACDQEARGGKKDEIKKDDTKKHDTQTVAWLAGFATVPAFSLNTTAEETGSRFLIANYRIEPEKKESEITPADSFLDRLKSDLPLSTAARLSANFPYVSPMPRLVPAGDDEKLPAEERNIRGLHFGDGGYFDNDGTASAMEFLWYALKGRKAEDPLVPVLILEIRDGPDPSGAGDPAPKEKNWGSTDQALGPLLTFYNANHVSVTRRNRRELCFMERALDGKASFTHMVLPYRPPKEDCPDVEECPAESEPLSWHLTGKQKDEITLALGRVQQAVHGAAEWYAKATTVPVKNSTEARKPGQEEKQKPLGCDKWRPELQSDATAPHGK
jgi:hypothetical protein